MNNHDLKRMNDHDYLSKKIRKNLRREKFIACIIWAIAIICPVLLIILVLK
tara:strand:+ start:950 stop:1102 length:153 start_codon:yes stop_codon:yes gene_type:complete